MARKPDDRFQYTGNKIKELGSGKNNRLYTEFIHGFLKDISPLATQITRYNFSQVIKAKSEYYAIRKQIQKYGLAGDDISMLICLAKEAQQKYYQAVHGLMLSFYETDKPPITEMFSAAEECILKLCIELSAVYVTY